MTTKQLSIDDIRERIISTEKVAHVTFYLVRDELFEDHYFVYSTSEDRGLDIVRDEDHLYRGESIPYNDALMVLRSAIQHLEEILERKRKGPPTQKQVYFLFRKKIPIPPTLTWGEASDLIDECLAQIKREKQAKHAERFMGLQVGMRVYQYFEFNGRWITNKGEITKLTLQTRGLDGWAGDNYAYVKWDNTPHSIHVSRVSIGTLKREIEGEPLKPTSGFRPPIIPNRYGEKVHHPQYGKGTILHAGDILANVQFQDGARMLNVTELEPEGNDGESREDDVNS